MEQTLAGPPNFRPLVFVDLSASLALGFSDFRRAWPLGLFFASFYVLAGLLMFYSAWASGHTFWLILAVLGFPLVGSFAAIGLYETSRRLQHNEPLDYGSIIGVVWAQKNGQLPWFAVAIVVIFLFWFFLGHMIFALFLGLAPMTNIMSSLEVFLTGNGLAMLAFGGAVGAAISTLVFAMTVLGLPMLLDRDVDFVTALLSSIRAVSANPARYLLWGVFLALCSFVAMIPAMLGLFIALPVLGHATWHLYQRLQVR